MLSLQKSWLGVVSRYTKETRKLTYQEAESLGAPKRRSSKTRPVAAKGRHWGNHRGDIQKEQIHTEGLVAGLRAAGTNNGADSTGQPMKAREQWQQTCGMDALQYMIASGSCCCSPQEGSCCRFVEIRTAHLAAIAHSQAGCHG